MVPMGILHVIDDGPFVCMCKVYFDIIQTYTPHAFVYDSNFSQK